MMDKIYLENFKAFKSPTNIALGGDHLLVFGENGAGKSSMAEALKLFFYKQRIFDRKISPSTTDAAARANEESDIIRKYRHSANETQKFKLEINDKSFPTDTLPDYQVNIIQRGDIQALDEVNVHTLLYDVYIPIADVAANLDDEQYREQLVDWVNDTLHNYFMEKNITVDIHYYNSQYLLRITDSQRSLLTRNKELTKYFNEGKLHAINMLLVLGAIYLNYDPALKRVTVLDDVFSSLDSSYRLAFIKLICENFSGHQLIVLTHSLSFFNQLDLTFQLFQDKKYNTIQIVECGGEAILHTFNSVEAKDLLKDYRVAASTPGAPLPGDLPNKIRRRFEYLLQEYSKVLSIGGISECGKLLGAIIDKDALYFRQDANRKILTVHDMVKELIAAINSCSDQGNRLKTQLESIVDSYRSTVHDEIRNHLLDLKMYQKVTMNGGSHSPNALPMTVSREVEQTLFLMINMERLIKPLIGRDLYTY